MNRRQFIDRSLLALGGIALTACIDEKKAFFEKNQVIACFGDSITASEEGYVRMLQLWVDQAHSELNLRFLNYGRPSETVTGLTEKVHPGPRPVLFDRLDAELDKTPIDVAFFCYGINCGIYGGPSNELFDLYKNGVNSFLKKMKERDIDVILLTPPPLALDVVFNIQTNAVDDYGYLNPYPEYDKEVLQEFKQIILNTEHRSILAKIDIHGPLFDKRIDCYTDDPIHPNQNGHQLIASTIIDKIGF
ncbi:MAG: SGNH/GDSL hydrolase family protein [Aurantibacter sp.]